MGKLESFELNPNIRTKVTVKTIFSQQQTDRQTSPELYITQLHVVRNFQELCSRIFPGFPGGIDTVILS